MTPMDTFVLLPEPGHTATVILTGVVTHTSARGDGSGVAVVDPDGQHPVCLPLGDGVRVIPGDIMPTLLGALGYAIECAGAKDPGWMAPELLDWVDQWERAQDELRGVVTDED